MDCLKTAAITGARPAVALNPVPAGGPRSQEIGPA